MNLLRRYIRQILCEVYELSDDEKKARASRGENRAIGLQYPVEQIRDRKHMKDFNHLLNTTPEGRKIIQQFRSGDGSIQVLHSITYMGLHTKRNNNWNSIFSDWIQQNGTSGKDALSCIAINAPIGKKGQPWNVWKQHGTDPYNTKDVLMSIGFLMKGYPSYISKVDAYTQTLTALIPTAKEAWKNSGIAKRPNSWAPPIDFDDWPGSDEVILDNWSIIGIYVNKNFYLSSIIDSILNDAKQVANKYGIPLYTVEDTISTGPAALREYV